MDIDIDIDMEWAPKSWNIDFFHAGFPPFALGSEGGHIPTFWLLLHYLDPLDHVLALKAIVTSPKPLFWILQVSKMRKEQSAPL